VADEAFEAFWRMKGGPEIVAMHSIFGGVAVPSEAIRQVLGLTLEQFRTIAVMSGSFGLVDSTDEYLLFTVFQKDSAQGSRLEWCLEDKNDEFQNVVKRL